MQKRALALAAVLLLLILALISYPRPIEPSYQGKTVTVWLNELATNIAKKKFIEPTREPALQAIFEIGPEALPYLRRALREGNLPSQKALDRIRSSLPGPLRTRLPAPPQTNAWALKTAAAHSLAAFGPSAHDAIPDLIDCIERSENSNDDSITSSISSHAIYQIGPRAEHFPSVQRLLVSTNQNKRLVAFECLGLMGVKDPKAIELLVKTVSQNQAGPSDSIASICAIQNLGKLKVDAPHAQTALREALTNSLAAIRISAALALRKISGPDKDTDSMSREILKDLKAAKPSPPGLFTFNELDHHLFLIANALAEEKSATDFPVREMSSLHPSNIHGRLALAYLLWKHTGQTNHLQRAWGDGLFDSDHSIRHKTAIQMHEICTTDNFYPLDLDLHRMLKHDDQSVRVFAAATLWKLSGETEQTIPILLHGLRDHFTYSYNAKIRETAATALGEMGPKAAAAKEPLAKLLHDPDPKVRAAARSALRKLN